MKSFSTTLVFSAVAFLAACGEEGPAYLKIEPITFSLFKGGRNVACSTVAGIDRVEANLYTPDGSTLRPGSPHVALCQDGQVRLVNAPEGDHVLEVIARGPVLGLTDAVLYKARTAVTFPTAPLELSLKPEVAFLTVDWSFDDSGLDPCVDEVAEIEVLLSASASQQTTYNQRFLCSERPSEVNVPLPLLNFTIQVDAYSSEGFPLYSATAQRVLERGENEYTAILMSRGARVYLDWQFQVGTTSIRACDDAEVGAQSITVNITVDKGNQTATEIVDCAESRPYAFTENRYQAGNELMIELVADGAARFLGRRAEQTTGEDLYVRPPIVLYAVGSATVAIAVDTSSCAQAAYDAFSVIAVNVEDPSVTETLELGSQERSATFADLPYGTYDVAVVQTNHDVPVCTALGRRTISGRENAWAAIEL
jgi:hypothetical protein